MPLSSFTNELDFIVVIGNVNNSEKTQINLGHKNTNRIVILTVRNCKSVFEVKNEQPGNDDCIKMYKVE